MFTSTKTSVLNTRHDDGVLILSLLHSLGHIAGLELVWVKLRQLLKKEPVMFAVQVYTCLDLSHLVFRGLGIYRLGFLLRLRLLLFC